MYSEGSVDDLSLGAEEAEKEQQRKSQQQHKSLKLYLAETPWKLTIQLTDKLFNYQMHRQYTHYMILT